MLFRRGGKGRKDGVKLRDREKGCCLEERGRKDGVYRNRQEGWFLEGEGEKGWRLKEREGESIVFRGGGRERMAFKGESIVFRGERGRKDGV